MSYHHYSTRAFIISSRPYREADKVYTLFTEEFGLVRAAATGVRHLKSKLRFSLQDLSLISVTLVRGKEYWRITNALAIEPLPAMLADREKTAVYARLFSLVARLVQGDGDERHIFSSLVSSLPLMRSAVDADTVSAIEFSLALRILYALGYVGAKERFTHLGSPSLSDEEIADMKRSKRLALETINASLKASQL
jgi:DNA repair protein RecO